MRTPRSTAASRAGLIATPSPRPAPIQEPVRASPHGRGSRICQPEGILRCITPGRDGGPVIPAPIPSALRGWSDPVGVECQSPHRWHQSENGSGEIRVYGRLNRATEANGDVATGRASTPFAAGADYGGQSRNALHFEIRQSAAGALRNGLRTPFLSSLSGCGPTARTFAAAVVASGPFSTGEFPEAEERL